LQHLKLSLIRQNRLRYGNIKNKKRACLKSDTPLVVGGAGDCLSAVSFSTQPYQNRA